MRGLLDTKRDDIFSYTLTHGIGDFRTFTNDKTIKIFLKTNKYVSKSYHAFLGYSSNYDRFIAL
jgi:hypothetical protein